MRYAARAVLRLLHRAAVALALAGPVAADESGPAMCERAVGEAARAAGVPAEVLLAIALTETGRLDAGRLRPWPWAVNREGRGFWFDSREEALAFARASIGEGRRSFDMGCFQINYHWHGRGFPSIEAMADPAAGARYAAGFLRALHGELGDWSAAAGAYHSRTPALAERYRRRFDRILAGLGGSADAPASTALPEPPRATVRRVRGPRIITMTPDGPVEGVVPTDAAPADADMRQAGA